jgi:hypothetical protein
LFYIQTQNLFILIIYGYNHFITAILIMMKKKFGSKIAKMFLVMVLSSNLASNSSCMEQKDDLTKKVSEHTKESLDSQKIMQQITDMSQQFKQVQEDDKRQNEQIAELNKKLIEQEKVQKNKISMQQNALAEKRNQQAAVEKALQEINEKSMQAQAGLEKARLDYQAKSDQKQKLKQDLYNANKKEEDREKEFTYEAQQLLEKKDELERSMKALIDKFKLRNIQKDQEINQRQDELTLRENQNTILETENKQLTMLCEQYQNDLEKQMQKLFEIERQGESIAKKEMEDKEFILQEKQQIQELNKNESNYQEEGEEDEQFEIWENTTKLELVKPNPVKAVATTSFWGKTKGLFGY